MLSEIKQFSRRRGFKDYVLGCDIGGTNTTIAVAGLNFGKPVMLFSFRYSTSLIKDAEVLIASKLKNIEDEHNIKIRKACIAVAGVVEGKYARTQNIPWDVDAGRLKRKSHLEKIALINDFVAIGHAINLLPANKIICIQKGRKQDAANKAIIGAGTGLGKCILLPDGERYKPIASEGGHSDFPCQEDLDVGLVRHIAKINKSAFPVSCEMLLSGRGLEGIYSYAKMMYGQTKVTRMIDNHAEKPALISMHRKKDIVCRKVFEMFSRAYAIAARNFCLEGMSFGGLYLAGGIAAKNQDIFSRKFTREFCRNRVFGNALKAVPVYLIKEHDVGLYGAVFYASLL